MLTAATSYFLISNLCFDNVQTANNFTMRVHQDSHFPLFRAQLCTTRDQSIFTNG